jgi:competence protein ComEA
VGRVGARRACLLACALLWCSAALAQVDINSASEAQLDGIRGVGPATTRRILAERERQPFKDWADLVARVRGIGRTNAANFSAQGFTVNGQPYPGAREAGHAAEK